MTRLSSNDENGVLVHIGPQKLWLEHDPLGIGETVRYDFIADLWHLAETSSQAFVKTVAGKVLKDSSEFNDYSGFGKSVKWALEVAEVYVQEFSGAGLDVSIETTLEFIPVMHDRKTPVFYNKHARMFRLPKYQWRMADGGQSLHEKYGSKEIVTVWKNGDYTYDGRAFIQKFDAIRDQDGAASIRKEATP